MIRRQRHWLPGYGEKGRGNRRRREETRRSDEEKGRGGDKGEMVRGGDGKRKGTTTDKRSVVGWLRLTLWVVCLVVVTDD